MLSSLVSLDPTLPSSAAQALNGAADEISKRLSDQVDESGPHFFTVSMNRFSTISFPG